MDDLYLHGEPDIVASALLKLRHELRSTGNLRVHEGSSERASKCIAYSPNLSTLIDSKPPGTTSSPCGLGVLGIPLGRDDYVNSELTDKIDEFEVRLGRLHLVPGRHLRWLILTSTSTTRFFHWLRNLPPRLTARHAERLNFILSTTACAILGWQRHLVPHHVISQFSNAVAY